MKALDVDRTSVLKASVISEGGYKPHVFQVTPAEWKSILIYVVQPFFVYSPQLLSPMWPGSREVVRQWHIDGKTAEGAVAGYDPTAVNTQMTWFSYPGLVKFSYTSSKKRIDLRTACVFPATHNNIYKAFAPFNEGQNGRHVSWNVVRGKRIGTSGQWDGYYWVEFDLMNADVVAKASDEKWEAQEPHSIPSCRVGLLLHDLIYFMKAAYQRWEDVPGRNPNVYSTKYVVLHLGECRKGCCCPWHLDMRTQQENVRRYNKLKRRKVGEALEGYKHLAE